MNVSRVFVRKFSQNVVRRAEGTLPGSYKQVYSQYAKFQADNGLKVHQRGGTTDYILFGLTVVVNAFGLGLMGTKFYNIIYHP